jgi:hypothetical protein
MAVKSNLKKKLPSRLKEPFPDDKFEDLLVFGYQARGECQRRTAWGCPRG